MVNKKRKLSMVNQCILFLLFLRSNFFHLQFHQSIKLLKLF